MVRLLNVAERDANPHKSTDSTNEYLSDTTTHSGRTTSLPSLVDHVDEMKQTIRALEHTNTSLRDTIRRLRRTAYGGLIPTDTLDVALCISVVAVLVLVGKIVARSNA